MRKLSFSLILLGFFGILMAQPIVGTIEKSNPLGSNSDNNSPSLKNGNQVLSMANRIYSLVGTAFYKGDGFTTPWWDYDIDFTYAGKSGNEHYYKINRQEILKNGEFKVRENHDWVLKSFGFNDLTIISPDLFGWVGENIKALDRRVYDMTFIVDSLNNSYSLSLQYSPALKLNAIINKASSAPVIDGTVDAVWGTANSYNIDQAVAGTTPTLGASGTTTWKGLWNDNGIYVLLQINDNVYFPAYSGANPGNVWEYDKPEIYYDVNSVLADGKGPADINSGHIQIAPDLIAANINGTMVTDYLGVTNAFKVTNPNYTAEYFIPFSRLLDKNGIQVAKTAVMGFDVSVIDRDSEGGFRQRAVWTNFGRNTESWSNMDDCGTILLVGSGANVLVTEVTVTSAGNATTITSEAGTMQMGATILPVDATNKTVTWTVTNGTGKASISAGGLLTAIEDGTVTVYAKSNDGSELTGSKTITISNQYISFADGSIIKDGGFETNGPIAGFWGAGSSNGGSATVINGVCKIINPTASLVYATLMNQGSWTAFKDTSYNLSFTAWSDVNRTIEITLEDINNNYNRVGASTDASATNRRSDWWVSLTTSPQIFTLHVTMDQILPTTGFLLNIMTGNEVGPVYIDNISLVSVGYKPLGNGPPLGGTIASVASICSGTNTALTLSAYSGTIQWQKSADGTANWTNVSDGSGSTTATYTTGNLTSTTYFRAAVSKPDYTDVYSNGLTVTVNPLPGSAGAISGNAYICSAQNKVVGYSVAAISNASTYIWALPAGVTGTSISRTINVKYGSAATSGNVTVKGHNSCGDGAISTLPVTLSKPFADEKICLVTVDLETGKNMVVWEKTHNAGIVSYNVYREGSVVNSYDLIGNVPFGQMTVFVDLTSNPEQQQYTYKISVIDTCGNESAKSPWHQTMFLQYVSSVNGVNLKWEDYKTESGAVNFDSYAIFRGTSASNLTELATIASSSVVYTDKSAQTLSQKMYYRVGGVLPNPCDPAELSGKKTSVGPFVHSLSNLEDNRLQGTGVNNQFINAFNLSVYPSPFTDLTTISYYLQKPALVRIEVFNVVGEKIAVLRDETQNSGAHETELKASDVNFANGLYYIRVVADDLVITKKTMLNK
jgi:hypothetical protein